MARTRIDTQTMMELVCEHCQTDLNDLVHVQCLECVSEDVRLCIPCFAWGYRSDGHLPTHRYRICERLIFPVVTLDWAADEELLLVDGLSQYGMGNWAAVSEYVRTKSKEECERHYYDMYVNSSTWPLPVSSFVSFMYTMLTGYA